MYTQSAYSFDIATFLDLEIGSFYRKIPLWLQYRFSCASKLKAIYALPSLARCHLQVFAKKQRNTYNHVQTCGKLCSGVILYKGLDMEADLF